MRALVEFQLDELAEEGDDVELPAYYPSCQKGHEQAPGDGENSGDRNFVNLGRPGGGKVLKVRVQSFWSRVGVCG